MQETSTKPYLIRALHDWCTDNGYTPYIVVSVDDNTLVPVAHIHDGQITLNIALLATNGLVIGNEFIEFEARFSGNVEHIVVPIAAVSAIYARETGAGMGFDVTESQPYPGTEAAPDADGTDTQPARPELAGSAGKQGTPAGPDDKKPDDGKRPQLKIIK
ncbi:MAG TPA: ClpXP protease specificity-enhancing factor [Burkholderiaceae bacterium]|nr:ClpXP protease specificity-enhancing factor [Burkholderiaceae bacterium]